MQFKGEEGILFHLFLLFIVEFYGKAYYYIDIEEEENV